jgi:hypothetical protein
VFGDRLVGLYRGFPLPEALVDVADLEQALQLGWIFDDHLLVELERLLVFAFGVELRGFVLELALFVAHSSASAEAGTVPAKVRPSWCARSATKAAAMGRASSALTGSGSL